MAENLDEIIPGVSTIEKVLATLSDVEKALALAIGAVESSHIPGMLHSAVKHIEDGLKYLGGKDLWKWSHISTYTQETLAGELLRDALGVDTHKFDHDAKQGLATIDGFFNFIIALTYGSVGIGVISKMFLANRIPENLMEPIIKLPEEMGISWAIGTFMETILEAAVGRSIEEGIAEQKRPTRLDWPILRTMLKQHILKEKDLEDWLKKLGYPDSQIEWIKKLADQQLPIGDLQQLYLYKLMEPDEVESRIVELGFTKEDAKLLRQLYIEKGETTAGSMLRSTARGLAREDLITLDQYKGYLEDTHLPDREISDDLKALQLEKDNGRLRANLSALKTLYQHGKSKAEQTRKNLAMLGYSEDAITDLLLAWDQGPLPRHRQLSQSRILSYYVSKILTPEQTHDQLLASGLREEDVTLIMEHPAASNAVHMRQLSPGTVIEAYIAGALHIGDLEAAFKRAHVPDEDIQKWLTIAKYRYANTKHHGTTTKSLTDGQVLEAYNYGIYDQGTAMQILINDGYSAEDATVLLEIKNKGVFQPPSTPLFGNLGDAIAFMESHGYNIIAPQDPKLTAAEGMLAAAGYSWLPKPVNNNPPLP